jgi:hypothetical protein
MSTIEEKTKVIINCCTARRIKRELEKMIISGICQVENISVLKNYTSDKEIEYHVSIFNNKDKRHYTFILHSYFPFRAPKLILNSKPYSEYFRFKSESFKKLFNKYKGERCFCCETKLCDNTWGPHYLLSDIMDEVNNFHNECREISNIICAKVIQRKYLVQDINLLQWLV